MLHTKAKVGLRVVRSKGDYVVGRTGTIIEWDGHKCRARVMWDGESKTWVSVDVIEPEYEPYEIKRFTDADRNPKTNRMPYPKYIKK